MANFDTAIALARKRLKESFVCTADYRVCFPGVSCLGGICADPPAILSIACEVCPVLGACEVFAVIAMLLGLRDCLLIVSTAQIVHTVTLSLCGMKHYASSCAFSPSSPSPPDSV